MPQTAGSHATQRGRPPESNPHVLAAVSAREVSSVLSEIRTMYVVGLNAQVAVGRAGAQAAGFGRISERLNILGEDISDLIGEANAQAVAVSRFTYKLFMARRAYRPLESAAAGRAADSVSRRRLEGLIDEERTAIGRLQGSLETLEERIESLEYLALNARMEAAKMGDSVTGSRFDEVARHVHHSAQRMRGVMESVRPRLETMRQEIGLD